MLQYIATCSINYLRKKKRIEKQSNSNNNTNKIECASVPFANIFKIKAREVLKKKKTTKYEEKRRNNNYFL